MATTQPAAHPTSLITFDNQAGREVTWDVVYVSPVFPTHSVNQLPQYLAVTRRGGKGATYIVHVELDPTTGAVIRNGPVRPMGR